MKTSLISISPPVLGKREDVDFYSELKKAYDYNRQLNEQLNFALGQTQKTIAALENEIAALKKEG